MSGDATVAVAVGAVVVNYQAASVLPACVASLRANGVSQVVVVDNGDCWGPHDAAGEAALAEAGLEVTWVPAGANVGYGRAVNLGARSCPAGTPLLVCNPDIELRPGAVAAMVADLGSDGGVGVVGPRLLNADGSVYPSARTFPSMIDAAGHGLLGLAWPGNPFSRRYRLLDWDRRDSRVVDWVSGACFLIRRQAFDDVGGFDPRYFMYMEDVDLCWRVGRAGWRVLYQPAAEVVHAQGISAERHPYRMIAAHHKSMWQFARRSTTGWRRGLLPVVAAAVAARSAVACGAKWN
ncbi:MAG: glycosyltransferase family 2 protein, partial [Actinomycetota bacterium]|nr:glycosyltransferase family 2 protein [Actinomycetota bacterium]